MPNHLHFASGETSFGNCFGDLRSVTPIHFAGAGHVPHIEARFLGGLRLDMTPAVFTELLRAGQEALAKLPQWPEVNDAVGGEQ